MIHSLPRPTRTVLFMLFVSLIIQFWVYLHNSLRASETVSASKLDDHCSNHDCDTGPSKLILSEMVSVSTSNSGSDKVNISDAVATSHVFSVDDTAKLHKDANKFSGSLHCSFSVSETVSGKIIDRVLNSSDVVGTNICMYIKNI